MTTTTFSAGTVVEAPWLNDVNTRTYRNGVYVADYTNPDTDTPSQVATGIALAITAAKAAGKELHFEPGKTYTTNAETAFGGAANFRVYGHGCTIYRSTGAGVVASFDAGPSGARNDNIILQDFVFKGNASSTYGLYCRGISRSRVENIRAVDVTLAGFHISYCVLVTFKELKVSNNIDTFTVNPAKGALIDSDYSYTAACIFEDCSFEAPISDVGVDLNFGGFNTFYGGTCEGIPRGMVVRANSFENCFRDMDFEANTVYDVEMLGYNNIFDNCQMTSSGSSGTAILQSTSSKNTWVNGFLRWAALDGASVGTRFFGVTFSDNVSLGITGTGAYQAYGCTKVNTSYVQTAILNDVLGVQGNYTGTVTGVVSSPIPTITYKQVGNTVTISFPASTGTSNTTACTVTGMPAAIRPSTTRVCVGIVIDNGASTIGTYSIATSGTITLTTAATGVFTNVGQKGLGLCTITYEL